MTLPITLTSTPRELCPIAQASQPRNCSLGMKRLGANQSARSARSSLARASNSSALSKRPVWRRTAACVRISRSGSIDSGLSRLLTVNMTRPGSFSPVQQIVVPHSAPSPAAINLKNCGRPSRHTRLEPAETPRRAPSQAERNLPNLPPAPRRFSIPAARAPVRTSFVSRSPR